LAYALQAQANGADFLFDCEVRAADRRADAWRLATGRGLLRADVVLNCAGLFGDVVDELAGQRHFTIAPRKGQFVVLDKSARHLVEAIILPVPTAKTKGVLVARTVFGNLLIGPTAEDVDEREHPTVCRETLQHLLDDAARKLPAVRDHDVTAVFAGLRPATEHREYQVHVDAERGWVTVGGIRSTGLSGALGLAEHVRERMTADLGLTRRPLPAPVDTPVPNLAEHRPRDYQVPGYGHVVCHCELVTRRELEAALAGPMPARSIGALKRRTRVLMGRCQGFSCTGEVVGLARGRVVDELVAGSLG
jgi:glycerol-3-phosphate dehydrogenase